MAEARFLTAADLKTGLQAELERDIQAEDITSFAAISGDWNPLHMDEAYAAHTNYGARIVHGAFQVGLASTMAGMYLPGREVVVGAFQSRFPAPLRYPAKVKVLGEITSWMTRSTSGNLRVRVVELPSQLLTAEINVSFSLHEGRATATLEDLPRAQAAGDQPIVLITGARGGIGQTLVSQLTGKYQVIGLSRTAQTDPDVSGAKWVNADVGGTELEEAVERELAGRPLFGVVHAAWPTGPQGSLLEAEEEAVRAQVEFGSLTTIRLARMLRRLSAGPARMVILGTTAATLKPVVAMSAYSLGKATLEHTVRLLAPELARGGITINLVCPGFVPVGMNSAKTTRVVLTETAKVPLGRLCQPDDVSAAIEFLLSPQAAFFTGQMMPLTGGQL